MPRPAHAAMSAAADPAAIAQATLDGFNRHYALFRDCARLAKRFGVRLGAHPGPWSRDDMGRGTIELRPDELELLLLHQVGALEVEPDVADDHDPRLAS